MSIVQKLRNPELNKARIVVRSSLQAPKSSGRTKGLIPLPRSRDGSERSLLDLVMGLHAYASRPALVID